MASRDFFLLISAIALFSAIFVSDAAGSVGINYGRVANNLPSPGKVVELLKSRGINKVKLYDTDATVLTALANSGITVVVALPNELLASIAVDQSTADNWVQSNITKFYPQTKIEATAVGNEVFVDPNNTTNYLVPAMKNIHASLVKSKLDSAIKISSPLAFSALQNSYPSSAGSFKQELVEHVIKPMLDFLKQTGSYLMVNAYPFFAYSANSNQISPDYDLFKDNPGVVDSGFEAQIDAVFAALSAIQ
ncbi:putative Stigma-specific Stig1 family protein [Hibiscus syriacus]|uniref:glucan endo-1,3-beta-D-glucosidase n=1 Tax=Hibiscus syriacus TaxID=106335 RepID=A0A6A3AY02_HIBSY|nr:putative Stigma-specific Stig1 family protein [Hibiscus syriacus]